MRILSVNVKKKNLEISPAVFIPNNTANHVIIRTDLYNTNLVVAYV